MVMQKVHPVVENGRERGGCPHHWYISEAHGESSTGVCRLCGEAREFYNWMSSLAMFGGDMEKSVEGGLKSGEKKRGVPTPFNPINIAHELHDIRG